MAQMLKKIIKILYLLIFNLDFQGILRQQSGQSLHAVATRMSLILALYMCINHAELVQKPDKQKLLLLHFS